MFPRNDNRPEKLGHNFVQFTCQKLRTGPAEFARFELRRGVSPRSVEIIRQHRVSGDEDASVYAAVLESSGRKDKRSGMQLTHGFLSFGGKMSLSGLGFAAPKYRSKVNRCNMRCTLSVLHTHLHTFDIARRTGVWGRGQKD